MSLTFQLFIPQLDWLANHPFITIQKENLNVFEDLDKTVSYSQTISEQKAARQCTILEKIYHL